jgi:hypothetical protein
VDLGVDGIVEGKLGGGGSTRYRAGAAVTVRVFVMLGIYFVSVKYMFVSIKLMCVYVKLLKI